MNCQQATRYIWDYCDNKLSPELSAAVESHCRECQHCNKHLQLTILENDSLKNHAELPGLSPDFTARVMKSIPDCDFGPGKTKASRRPPILFKYKRWMVASSAILGLLLVLLVLPGINPSGIINFTKQSVMPPSSNQEEPPQHDIRFGHIALPKIVKSQALDDASATEEKRLLSTSGNTSADVEPPPPPTSYSSPAPDSSSTISRGTTVNENTNDLNLTDAPYNIVLPGTYTLSNITGISDNSLSYQFAQEKTNIVVNLIVSPVKNHMVGGDQFETPSTSTAPESNQATAKASREQASNSEISWTVMAGNASYRLTLNGNLSPQELALLAGSISFTVK